MRLQLKYKLLLGVILAIGLSILGFGYYNSPVNKGLRILDDGEKYLNDFDYVQAFTYFDKALEISNNSENIRGAIEKTVIGELRRVASLVKDDSTAEETAKNLLYAVKNREYLMNDRVTNLCNQVMSNIYLSGNQSQQENLKNDGPLDENSYDENVESLGYMQAYADIITNIEEKYGHASVDNYNEFAFLSGSYFDLVDFDGDGIEELLAISYSQNDDERTPYARNYLVEVYAYNGENAVQIFSHHGLPEYGWGDISNILPDVTIIRSGSKMYLLLSEDESGSGVGDYYYSKNGNEFNVEKSAYIEYLFEGNEAYYVDDKEVSYDEYNRLLKIFNEGNIICPLYAWNNNTSAVQESIADSEYICNKIINDISDTAYISSDWTKFEAMSCDFYVPSGFTQIPSDRAAAGHFYVFTNDAEGLKFEFTEIPRGQLVRYDYPENLVDSDYWDFNGKSGKVNKFLIEEESFMYAYPSQSQDGASYYYEFYSKENEEMYSVYLETDKRDVLMYEDLVKEIMSRVQVHAY